ncbi:MAG: undecaprenyl-diphosphate phosphatase [Bacilli bacterium]|nr:undecaprenyl-diphosphate phosphatase [Bacilli bacterium]
MNIIKYILLGILQGITEPLPISSSGHLFLFKTLFNTKMFNDLNFEIVVNFGSFLAILFIFRKEVIELVTSFFKFIFKKDTRKKEANNFKYCLQVIISTIPAGIIGLLFKDAIENKLENIKVVGGAFLITALALFIVKNISGTKDDKDITYKDALIIGLCQAIALLPGISRSGAVLVGCLLCKFKRETALKYTFILYFPISVATMILGIKDMIGANMSGLFMPYTLGLIASGIVTYFTYSWMSELVKKGKLWKFSIYCLALAIFIFIYFR